MKIYVVYARSCGVKEKVVVKHIFRNSIQTAVAAFCMAIPGMMAGTVVIENVFAWPGLGRLCVSSIFKPRFTDYSSLCLNTGPLLLLV